jgi:hypothetical protein
MALRQCSAVEAEAAVSDLVSRDVSVPDVYALIQREAAPRILVDKTPGYALDIETLRDAEAIFDRPRYIHLTRHPAAVVESVVHNRFNRLVGDDGDPYAFAEQVWQTAARNLAAFGAEVGDRCHRLRFEDLVAAPEATLTATCDFLGIRFEPAMLQPYSSGRMITGPGDPNIFDHQDIDAGKGLRWRDVVLPAALGADTTALAAELGYEV